MDEAISRRDVLRRGVRFAGISGTFVAAGGLGPSWTASARERSSGRGLADGAPPTLGFVLTSEQFPGPELIELGVGAEEAGFDAIWTSDHFLPWQDDQGHAGHAWVLLGGLAQRTKRVKLGTGVTCPIYRYPPAIVAQARSRRSRSTRPGESFSAAARARR